MSSKDARYDRWLSGELMKSPKVVNGIATEPLIGGNSMEIKPDERNTSNQAPVGEDRESNDLARSDAVRTGSAESGSRAASGKADEVNNAAPQGSSRPIGTGILPAPAAAAPDYPSYANGHYSTDGSRDKLTADALSRQPSEEAKRLMRFYSVDTLEGLVRAQAEHVERLQTKLQPLRDARPGYTPREG